MPAPSGGRQGKSLTVTLLKDLIHIPERVRQGEFGRALDLWSATPNIC